MTTDFGVPEVTCPCVYVARRLARSQWGHVSAYRRRHEPDFSFKKLYMQLDEAQLTMNADVDSVRLLLLYLDTQDRVLMD